VHEDEGTTATIDEKVAQYSRKQIVSTATFVTHDRPPHLPSHAQSDKPVGDRKADGTELALFDAWALRTDV
jgi:hypothetical protein